MRKSVAGNGKAITLVRVSCRKAYQEDFPPGTRVRISGSSEKARRSLNGEVGTVFSWKSNASGRAMIYLDDTVYFNEADDVGMCRLQSVAHREIHQIAEPPRKICTRCEMLLDEQALPVRWRTSTGEKGGCGFYGPDRNCDGDPV